MVLEVFLEYIYVDHGPQNLNEILAKFLVKSFECV